ncbi:MAG: hypothetical protein WAZ18_02705 [Alphaproteobacteria bacterium]
MTQNIAFGPYNRKMLARARLVIDRLKSVDSYDVLRQWDDCAARLGMEASKICRSMEDEYNNPVDVNHPTYSDNRAYCDGVNQCVMPFLSVLKGSDFMRVQGEQFLECVVRGECADEDQIHWVLNGMKALVRVGENMRMHDEKTAQAQRPNVWGRVVGYFEKLNDERF